MDSMTQSAQISSSQGFADGQNSAAKESKLSDSFLSSSPVSLIQSPQDKKVVQGSDKPYEGVATLLHFPSQPASFSPSSYGSEAGSVDEQQDSPIKMSPVSERIKALEALAAKKKEPDFRGNGGFVLFKDRHHEKSLSETSKSPTEMSKTPTATSKSPPDVSKSPPDMSKSPPDMSKSPPDVSKSPPDVSKSPPDVSKSPPDVSKSPPDVSKSPPDVSKSPPDAPRPPAEGPRSISEKMIPTLQKVGDCADHESPESPFEILEDLRHVNEFEETEQWMKAHLPPVPDFDCEVLVEGKNAVPSKLNDLDTPAAIAGVPDVFMDCPVEVQKLKEELVGTQKTGVEEEFDVSFLPTAYMWDRQEKSSVEAPSNLESAIQFSAPSVGFDSTPSSVSPRSCPDANQNFSNEMKASWSGDFDQPDTSEADSSGESDDTVIEDSPGAPASVFPSLSKDSVPVSTTPAQTTMEMDNDSPKCERKLMQVPTINVIETDEPNYSEEEMDMESETEEGDNQVVKDLATEAPKISEPDDDKSELPKTRPLETEFMEGYSPPSSPVDSDDEYSPKHKILKSNAVTGFEPVQPNPAGPLDSMEKSLQAQFDKSPTTLTKVTTEHSLSGVTNEEVDFANDDEWSEVKEILVKPEKTCLVSEIDEKGNVASKEMIEPAPLSRSSSMQDDIYDRQSFDYDSDATAPLEHEKGLSSAKERFLSDAVQSGDVQGRFDMDRTISLSEEDFIKSDGLPPPEEYPPNPYSCFESETKNFTSEQESMEKVTTDDVVDDIKNANTPLFQKPDSDIHQINKVGLDAPDITSSDRSDDNSSVSEPTDSFVDFMKECLKSRQDDEEADGLHQSVPSPYSSSPSMVMDLEQEHLTISALKELGNSQDEEGLVSEPNQSNPSSTSMQSMSSTPDPPPSFSQDNRVCDNTYSREVEVVDEWVAEAYHLAEHVLTAILTHLSVKDLIHWRDPKKSGLVFGLSMLLLLSLAAFSVISVASYLLLALLCVTITFRIYKSIVQAVQKSAEGHPFKALLEKDVSIPPETFRKHVDSSLTYINRALQQMSRLFLVEDLVDSLKLAVVMWLLTYVGAVFNGITILILADILLFAVPPVYEKNKTQIDQYIDLVRTRVNAMIAKLQEKLPGAVKRAKTE
ncbi:transcript variant X1 [Nothobranchius furzeri]|uniref:Reticulon n=1 Tax=Nothobranchius furzeri TaxID=105023 RepID=A0A9D2XRM8_NOTFU|nr:transcript variant X1 [Nothobranchius furzeri]